MALTRKFLSALGIDADKIDEIISAHSETVNGLKEKISENADASSKLEEVQKKYDELKKSFDEDNLYKEKYETEKQEFESYKNEQTEKETKAQKKNAYKKLLKEAGVSDKHLDAVLRVSDVDSIEIGEDGKIKDESNKLESIKKDWSDFITTKDTKGADTSTPPAHNDNNGAGNAAEARKIYEQLQQSHYGIKPQGNNGNNDNSTNNNNGGNE